MKVEITDEMVDVFVNALVASDYNDDVALEAVAPLIANEVLERAAVHMDHRFGVIVADAIRALKEPTP